MIFLCKAIVIYVALLVSAKYDIIITNQKGCRANITTDRKVTKS